MAGLALVANKMIWRDSGRRPKNSAWATLLPDFPVAPEIADTTIPAVVGFAEKKGVELPFSDYESLKTVAMSEAQEGIAGVFVDLTHKPPGTIEWE